MSTTPALPLSPTSPSLCGNMQLSANHCSAPYECTHHATIGSPSYITYAHSVSAPNNETLSFLFNVLSTMLSTAAVLYEVHGLLYRRSQHVHNAVGSVKTTFF